MTPSSPQPEQIVAGDLELTDRDCQIVQQAAERAVGDRDLQAANLTVALSLGIAISQAVQDVLTGGSTVLGPRHSAPVSPEVED